MAFELWHVVRPRGALWTIFDSISQTMQFISKPDLLSYAGQYLWAWLIFEVDCEVCDCGRTEPHTARLLGLEH
jgi:hypothetical protein